jgi:hypothetical protein
MMLKLDDAEEMQCRGSYSGGGSKLSGTFSRSVDRRDLCDRPW